MRSDWKHTVKRLVGESQWEHAFAVACQHYETLEANDPQMQEFKAFCEKLLMKYLDQLVTVLNDPFSRKTESEIKAAWASKILITVDFLLLVDCQAFLFTTVKDIFERYDLLECFIASLEHFILCNRVNHLNRKTIHQILSYFDVFL